MTEYEVSRIRRVNGRIIEIEHPELPKGPKTRLSGDLAAAGTALTVLDNSNFSTSHFALIRPLGTQRAEIGDITSVSGGTTINFTSGATFAHSAGEEVQQLIFNQVRLYGNSTNTSSGSTLIATIDLDVSESFTTYINTGTEYNFYFARLYDSVDAVESTNYSDGVSNSTGYVSNSVQNLINRSLVDSHMKYGGNIDFDFCLAALNQGMEYIRGKLKTWTSLQEFDYALGQSVRGTYSFTMPTTAYDGNSNRAILGVRVGPKINLTYKDKREWENELYNVIRTQVRTQAVANDTTLAIDNSYDFADAGTVTVFVSGTKYDITYTGVTRSATAGVLTGVPASGTGSISVTIAVDTIVWQNEVEGTPDIYTVYDGSIYLWPLPDANNDNFNITMDFYTDVVEVNSPADTISYPRFDALRHFLTWKLRSMKNPSGEPNLKDGDFLLFTDIVNDMIFQELNSSGQKWKHIPKVYN